MEYHSTGEEYKYFIYCQLHRPLNFFKVLELKNQKKKEEIYRYASNLEKNLAINAKLKGKQTLVTKFYSLENSSFAQSSLLGKKRKKSESTIIELSKNQSNRVVSKVKDLLNKIRNLSITVKYKEKSNQYEVIKKSEGSFVNIKEIFDINCFPWYMVNFPDILPKVAYNQFGKLCPDEKHFNSIVYNYNPKVLLNIQPVKEVKSKEEDPAPIDTTIYCYCHRQCDNNSNQIMINCSGDDSCPFNGWFHQDCVDELKGMTSEELMSPDFVFYCINCKHSDQKETKNKEQEIFEHAESEKIKEKVNENEKENDMHDENESNNFENSLIGSSQSN